MTYSLQIPSIMHKAMFGNLIHDFHKMPKRKSFPLTDLYRDEKGNQVIEMALAGYNKDLIKIEVRSNQITISATGSKTNRDSNIARRSFLKTFIDYNGEMNLSGAKASFKQGLLKVIIAPKISAKCTTIEIS
jgi:HSP20 family molecular chaperone IbpA